METAYCNICMNLQPPPVSPGEYDRLPEKHVSNHTLPIHATHRLDIVRSELLQSSRNGCKLCNLVLRANKFATANASILDRYTRRLSLQRFEGQPLEICNLISNSLEESKAYSRCHIHTPAASPASRKWPQIGTRCIPDRGAALSEDNLATAGSWLKDCLQNHPGCTVSPKISLPTRLIEVGSAGENPRLVLTEGTEGIRTYATLSHCWGHAKGLTTTNSTLDQHIKEIVFRDLPKSFQDAVTVSRSLGLPYLWIDSLCIIQDSKRDWERESQHMQDVYAHATLNISADAATDSTVGFRFTEQDIGEDMAVDEPGDVYAARGGCSALDTHGLSHIPRDSPAEEHVLRRRAWVLQERTLSRRILHFCKYELAWECDTCSRCVCSPSPRENNKGEAHHGVDMRDKPHIGLIYTFALEKIRFRDLVQQSGGAILDARSWARFVRLYSSLSLTHESDRPNAIAGIAKILSNVWSMSYAGGIWTEHLPYALLWYKKSPALRTSEVYASWSWISLAGEVRLWEELRHPQLFAADNFKCEFIRIIPGGNIQSPSGTGDMIELNGMLAEVTFDHVYMGVNNQGIRSHKTVARAVQRVVDMDGFLYTDACNLELIMGAVYHLLAVLDHSRGVTLYSLMLLEIPTAVDSVRRFRRVGICVSHGSRAQDYHTFRTIFQTEKILIV